MSEREFRRVAGHTFGSVTPGEWCRGENCAGVKSLVELCSGAEVFQVQDDGVAHLGKLTWSELEEIKGAAAEMRKRMEMVGS